MESTELVGGQHPPDACRETQRTARLPEDRDSTSVAEANGSLLVVAWAGGS